VALDLPAAARDELADWRDAALGGRDDLRLVPATALHVTLVFLGYRPEKEIPRIAELLGEAVEGRAAPRLSALEVKAVPPRRPRLFALDLADEEGDAVTLQQSVSDVLEAEHIYKPEKRPFWPHITLARVKRNRRAEQLETPSPPGREWTADAVTLYQSILRPQGAHYEPLAVSTLAAGG
jgi:2'-5' RNA ligase